LADERLWSVATEDEYWMQLALQMAARAGACGEVPVGAVVVCQGELLAAVWNQPITRNDPTAHAEIEAIRQACQKTKNYRLPEATLYVTLEPCVMCVGALVHARISRLVFGADEPKAGAVLSQAKLFETHPFNWHLSITRGVLAEECAAVLSEFFRNRRQQKKNQTAC
jgi:tRNA(adenine34) deaminase